jgi:hypothetical protein
VCAERTDPLGILATIALCAAAAIPTATACSAAAPPSAISAALGRRVTLNLPSHDGALVVLPLRNAQMTVIDAFAPTCKPCREKVPALLARRRELAAIGGELVLVGVLADGESTDDASSALRSWGVDASFLVDRGDVLRRECGVEVLPATLVLDASGAVRWVAGPTSTAADVVAAVRELAGE